MSFALGYFLFLTLSLLLDNTFLNSSENWTKSEGIIFDWDQASDPLPEIPNMQIRPCREYIDLIYVFDSSNSIGAGNFSEMILYAISLSSTFIIGVDDALVGAVGFSNEPKIYFDREDHPSIDDLEKNLRNIPYIGHKTRTDKALDFINNNGMLSTSDKVFSTVVVFTDGKSDNPDKTKQAAARIKARGFTINAVGFGDVFETELLDISSGAEHVFKSDNYNDLHDSVVQQACPPPS